LRAAGATADITVIDRSPSFRMGLRKLWLLDQRTGDEDGLRPRLVLNGLGITFRQGEIEGIDLERRRVRVDSDDMEFDYLVVALGAEPRVDLVQGGDSNPNLYDWQGAKAAAGRLPAVSSGRIVIAIAGLPIKCPPAPYEAAFLIDALLKRTGHRDRVSIQVMTPQPMSIPAAGQVACNSVEDQLAEHGIDFLPNVKIERLEAGRVVAGDATVEAELVIIAPPHRPPAVVKGSGLTGEGDWVQVNPSNLETRVENVFAIGDVVEMKTGAGLPFPKAGVFAESHGEVVASNIAARISGTSPTAAFDGVGQCFLEMGDGAASFVRGNFFSAPPDVEIASPDPAHLQAKQRFEAERLDRWLPV